ncbi:MAG: four helix bundle protein [Candidatus Magasanikbacteria bacterium CG10_big_fil_rev_8_21_14_0_10_42_10]|uniref:Four helix bundle protein n=2 Tax=Candidatus Magasanikiibacteriota TaxID=1752731 RepID=A0A2H0TWS1_9BACT|nr:MAG: four helix bundle protein [Candidatus Magasanikbacteria bacterium CG10_big_fil_rev_8_21_14_0_10_42_10]PIZ92877.1 MAG: four helix bundle protein [Candidatus Magasanikbacteria bacterium CG_4_10_14_0_2_um_filter_41_10]
MAAIQKFTDIKAWDLAHAFVLLISEVVKQFPKHEQYCLTSQLWRATVSVAANIVEGFYRSTAKERLRFYEISMSSLEETKYYIILAKDLNYITVDEARSLYEQANEVGKTLRGWMKHTK